MTGDERIKEALKGFAASAAATITGTVKEVDEVNATCSVDIGNNIVLEDVRLRATVNGDKGFYLIPTIDSVAFLIRIESSDEFLAVGYSEIDKVIYKGESASLEINNDQIIFNANELDSFGININSLIDRINLLEEDINSLKTVLTNWIPVPQDGGYSLKTASATWAGSQLVNTEVNDIKDPKILN